MTIDRNVLLVLLTLLALIAVPMGMAGARPVFEGMEGAPIVVGIELLAYFIAAMVVNPRATLGMAALTAIVFGILRAVTSLVGGAVGVAVIGTDIHFAMSWIHPITAIIQGLILITAGPYMLAVLYPDLVGHLEAARLLGTGIPSQKGSRSRTDVILPGLDAAPSGGFIQVFSFQELAAQLKKNPGLEGFVIYNDEGLVVWRDLPLKVDVEALSCRLVNQLDAAGGVLAANGLSRMKRCQLETRDHRIVTAPLNQNFGLILFFSGRTAPQEITNRLEVIVKSTREFLQWKYPSLPLATGLTRDRISVEMV